mmetsp:Transcript_9508/g.33686  ORF Transcript_9508/g.33686 Transcript_9508/m.33686 type:complete len:383 (+) Transcript_9508:82-1230(+)|eukprot:CAMPEP_0203965584 /NCGR_PEP_ID=MMETSP0359-20131031/95028_1 /ASSEMBLY_ACC=CAM_ASM_000338 /TAXON_ID=268821 /ORGANISM="Scrippsiella Hangoei, Strain SHTV-5" /LENGTH=382 /DNA_ID=CAMNT_0050902537 /DNA_START=89 /DNA_END=1237 /DNA_ORIENTATION=+
MASLLERLKGSGLPALVVFLPSFLWLALTCASLQAALLPLFLAGRRKEYYLASRAIFSVLHRPLVYLFEYSGSKIILHGNDVNKEVLSKIGHDQSTILVNHRGDLDWLVGLMILDAGGGLGCCKAMIKRELLMVPFFGFVWWAVDFVCLRRNWASDAKTLEESYKSQHAYRENQVPYSLTVFPEGTRLTQKKLEESQEFAKSRGLSVLKHVLCPRTKGLWSAVNGLRLDSIFDATVAPMGAAGNILTLAQAQPCELHIHIERVEPASVPKEEELLSKWLYGRWETKEKRLESFLAKGKLALEGEAASAGVPLKVRSSAAGTTLGAVIWWLLCTLGFVRWCLRNGRYGLLGFSSVGFLLLVVAMGAAVHAVHFTKSSHGKKAK